MSTYGSAVPGPGWPWCRAVIERDAAAGRRRAAPLTGAPAMTILPRSCVANSPRCGTSAGEVLK
jgi:hypothetical protein